jgi:hypothetical protein
LTYFANRWRTLLGGSAVIVNLLLGAVAVFAAPVDYEIPNASKAIAIRQPTTSTGWAAAAATMYAWSPRGDTADISLVLKNVAGGSFLALLANNRTLSLMEKVALLRAMNLKVAAPQNYTIAGWDNLLRNHGPLWVAVADGSRNQPYFSSYSRIVKKISGDGTMTGTIFTVVDPAVGQEHDEPVATFLKKFEQAARAHLGEGEELRPQIIHY